MNPMPFIIILVLSYGFEALLFGDELSDNFIPQPYDTHFSDCSFQPGQIPILSDVAAGVGYIGCLLSVIIKGLANAAVFVGNALMFIYFLVTFKIPGAPPLIRWGLMGTVSFGLIWVIVGVVRGKGD